MEETTTATQVNGNAEEPTTETAGTTEKVFTQEEVNKLVQERIKKETDKRTKAVADKDSELEELQKNISALQAEIDKRNEADKLASMRSKVAKESGVPVELLTGATEEDCQDQAKKILEFAKPSYPNLVDGGEVVKPKARPARDIFSEWMKNNLS